MRRGMSAGSALAVLALVAGCSSAPGATYDAARAGELTSAAEALGPVAAAWTDVETSSNCDGGTSCSDPGISFVSRRTGGSPQTVCAEAVPWLARSFGATATVEDCVRALLRPADSTTTQPGYTWDVLVTVAQVAEKQATWQITIYADEVDFGLVGSGATPKPVSYQAGGYLYDGDRVELIQSIRGTTASPS